MNILITAGGTSERIDDVRSIGNTATGRLGSLIADCFLEDEEVCVTYLCSKSAVRPQNPRARILLVDDVQSLQNAVESEMHGSSYDAVVHSMAVSDYTVKYSIPSEELAKRLTEIIRNVGSENGHLAEQIHTALLTCGGGPKAGKISSEIGHLFLCLEKTPKIIGLFKKLQPKTILVGFKLLSNVEESVLLQAAENLMERNRCDFVLANDLKGISEDRHGAILLGNDHSETRLGTRLEIVHAIKDSVTRKIEEDNRK